MPQSLPIVPVVHTEHLNPIVGLASSPWAPLVAVAGQKQVLFYNSDSLEPIGVLPFTNGFPAQVRFSRNGKLLIVSGGIGGKSGRVVIWDITTGKQVISIGNEYDTVLAADVSPDQTKVALGGPSRLVKIYSTQAGELVHKIKKHTDWVIAAEFSPNGEMLATADRNGGVVVWDPENGQELYTLAGHKAAATSVSWRGDSKLLASSGEDGTVKLWEMEFGKPAKSWNAHAGGVLWASYTHDGRIVSCGRDNQVVVWDGSGSKQKAMQYSGELPLRAVFNHNGERVFGSDFNGHVFAWNTKDGKKLGELNANPVSLKASTVTSEKSTAAVQQSKL
jgi:WD40 repeat protein